MPPPRCHRASRKLPGLSLHPKPPHPQELGAVPIFHPLCSNLSPHPSQGWKSPPGRQAGITPWYEHTQPGCPKASHHGTCCLGYPKTAACSHGLDWDAALSMRWRGTRQLLWHCSLQTHPGASQSNPSPGWGSGAAPAPQKTRGGLRRERVTSSTHGAAKNSAHNGGPVWPLVALNRVLQQGLSQHRNSAASGGKYSS